MDRRRRKTRAAIFTAFEQLLSEKPYGAITVRQIIERADVGRTTFYDNFETKDDLLRELCAELFDHIAATAAHRASGAVGADEKNASAPMGATAKSAGKAIAPGKGPAQGGDGATSAGSVFYHLLWHLREGNRTALHLLAGENSDVFTRYFIESLNDLVATQISRPWAEQNGVPVAFLANHVSGSFVEMVRWWARGGLAQEPAELDRWFRAVLGAALRS